MNTPLTLLNNLTPTQFLVDYWQKKPLLVRQAIPNFQGLMSPNELAGLACEEDVEARIIQQKKGEWQITKSPFSESDFTALPKKNWTLLVQGVNLHLPEATELLTLFNFIPHARLDDLMVSYAPKGGGVGPHLDSYDVFLLQGRGKRHWKISHQQNIKLDEQAPIKVMTNFAAEEEWILEAGDMLYLPPHVAHDGIAADDECMTYSIGFRAPQKQELIHEFLTYLQDNLTADGIYADADLSLQTHPAEISNLMVSKVQEILKKVTWDSHTVGDFLGHYLSEPKANIFFEAPRKINLQAFRKKLSKLAVSLSLKTQLLFYQNRFYMNGEPLIVPSFLVDAIQVLADQRFLDTVSMDATQQEELAKILYPAFIAGYIDFNDARNL
jgi:50S ribosomal protein L16 3-hydroxylase